MRMELFSIGPFTIYSYGLMIAVGIGVILNLFSMALNMLLQFRKKDMGEFWFSQNGVAGFVFYASIAIGVVLNVLFGLPVFNIIYIWQTKMLSGSYIAQEICSAGSGNSSADS